MVEDIGLLMQDTLSERFNILIRRGLSNVLNAVNLSIYKAGMCGNTLCAFAKLSLLSGHCAYMSVWMFGGFCQESMKPKRRNFDGYNVHYSELLYQRSSPLMSKRYK